MLEADRLEVGRRGDVDRDRRDCEGVRLAVLREVDESCRFGDLADSELADCGVREAALI